MAQCEPSDNSAALVEVRLQEPQLASALRSPVRGGHSLPPVAKRADLEKRGLSGAEVES